MWKENLYQPVEILLREHDEFPIGEHRHSFFEIVYILEGNGKFHAYTLGDEKECHGYMAGDLYLIPPERAYRFIINNPVDMSLSVSQGIMYQTILTAT